MALARFPHPLTLLTGCILTAALGSYVLPAGQYDRMAIYSPGSETTIAPRKK